MMATTTNRRRWRRRRAVDGAAAAVLLGGGEKDGRDGREVGSPVVVTGARRGVRDNEVEGGGSGAPARAQVVGTASPANLGAK